MLLHRLTDSIKAKSIRSFLDSTDVIIPGKNSSIITSPEIVRIILQQNTDDIRGEDFPNDKLANYSKEFRT